MQKCSTTAHSWRDGHVTSTKILWGVERKDQGSNLKKGVLHTYTHIGTDAIGLKLPLKKTFKQF